MDMCLLNYSSRQYQRLPNLARLLHHRMLAGSINRNDSFASPALQAQMAEMLAALASHLFQS
jgi:hypothetical protein